MTYLASHNSLTYAKPKRWWMKPLGFLAKCQDKTIWEQLVSGVTHFDIRMRMADSAPIACHGLIDYDVYVMGEIAYILIHARNHPEQSFGIRLVFERITDKSKSRSEYKRFDDLCAYVAKLAPDNVYISGRIKGQWGETFSANVRPDVYIREEYASYHNNKRHRIWGLFPRLWAMLNNKRLMKETQDAYLMIDFV